MSVLFRTSFSFSSSLWSSVLKSARKNIFFAIFFYIFKKLLTINSKSPLRFHFFRTVVRHNVAQIKHIFEREMIVVSRWENSKNSFPKWVTLKKIFNTLLIFNNVYFSKIYLQRWKRLHDSVFMDPVIKIRSQVRFIDFEKLFIQTKKTIRLQNIIF